jgi:hypothetical protein
MANENGTGPTRWIQKCEETKEMRCRIMKCGFCGKVKEEGEQNWVSIPSADITEPNLPCCPDCLFIELPIVSSEEIDQFVE